MYWSLGVREYVSELNMSRLNFFQHLKAKASDASKPSESWIIALLTWRLFEKNLQGCFHIYV